MNKKMTSILDEFSKKVEEDKKVFNVYDEMYQYVITGNSRFERDSTGNVIPNRPSLAELYLINKRQQSSFKTLPVYFNGRITTKTSINNSDYSRYDRTIPSSIHGRLVIIVIKMYIQNLFNRFKAKLRLKKFAL